MKNISKKRIMVIIILISFLVTATVAVSAKQNESAIFDRKYSGYDPLTENIEVTVEIQKIRSLEKFDHQIPTREKIQD